MTEYSDLDEIDESLIKPSQRVEFPNQSQSILQLAINLNIKKQEAEKRGQKNFIYRPWNMREKKEHFKTMFQKQTEPEVPFTNFLKKKEPTKSLRYNQKLYEHRPFINQPKEEKRSTAGTSRPSVSTVKRPNFSV